MPEGDPEEWPDVESLRAAREEARTVVDHQIDYLGDVNEKALRTVRVAVLVLAAFVSALRLAGPAKPVSPGTPGGALVVVGSVALVLSIVGGVLTYSVSQPTFGIGSGYLDDLQTNGDNGQWLVRLLSGYAEWMAANRRTNRRDSAYLWWTQLLFVIGVSLLSAGTGLLLFA